MKDESEYEEIFHELRGLISDLLRQLLGSFIHFEDKLMRGDKCDDDLVQADEQLSSAIETLLKIRDIINSIVIH